MVIALQAYNVIVCSYPALLNFVFEKNAFVYFE